MIPSYFCCRDRLDFWSDYGGYGIICMYASSLLGGERGIQGQNVYCKHKASNDNIIRRYLFLTSELSTSPLTESANVVLNFQNSATVRAYSDAFKKKSLTSITDTTVDSSVTRLSMILKIQEVKHQLNHKSLFR